MAQQAFFRGLVYDEFDNPVETKTIGGEAFYVVDDQGFLRHIEAEKIDRRILSVFLRQLEENKDLAITQAMQMMGKDDLFTKAALDAEMSNIDLDQILQQGLPEQARNMMSMIGFRVVIDVHGEIIRFDQPTLPDQR